MTPQEFLLLYPVRARNLMWLLGAGTSAAAGVPTAVEMVWDLKRRIYCAEQGASLRQVNDLGDPGIRRRLQQYFDSSGGHPPSGSPDQYAYYFEYAYPSETDRRAVLDSMLAGARPSYGHRVLGALMTLQKARVVWTTNFDATVEDAAAEAFGTTARLVVANIDNPQVARDALAEERFPVLAKIHGDFRSKRLKNVPSELREQDALLRAQMLKAAARYGLLVVGYSGRDASVMETLMSAAQNGGFPAGVFWFHRSDSPLLPPVEAFLEAAKARGIDANDIEIETFDEMMGDILRLLPDVPSDTLDKLSRGKPRITGFPVPPWDGTLPHVRLNALAITLPPTICRRVACGIGGYREVRAAIEAASGRIVAARRKVGVIAFGSDVEVRRVFAPYGITDFDIHSIEAHRLHYDSAELGLLYDALRLALERECPVKVKRRRQGLIASVDPARQSEAAFGPFRKLSIRLAGKVADTDLVWLEAVRLNLEYRLGTLWLLLEPTVLIDTPLRPLPDPAKEFVRQRMAARYNRQSDELMAAWGFVITLGKPANDLRAFGIGDGVDALFRIDGARATSERRSPR
jgi:hypothetical protein